MIVTQYSSADILAQALSDLGLVSFGAVWPTTIGRMPEVPDNAVATYDTTPRPDGRLMQGVVIDHPGVQVRVRATSHTVGHLKASSIAAALDAMKNKVVVLGGTTFTIQNASRVGGILPLGPEVGTNRVLFTINVTLTIREGL